MFKLFENKTIYLTRGDSAEFSLPLNSGSNLFPVMHEIDESDFIYFALMEPNQFFEDAILKKKLSYQDCPVKSEVNIKIEPKDTERLLPGRYYYSIKIQKNNSENKYDVYTIIDKKQFFILD